MVFKARGKQVNRKYEFSPKIKSSCQFVCPYICFLSFCSPVETNVSSLNFFFLNGISVVVDLKASFFVKCE